VKTFSAFSRRSTLTQEGGGGLRPNIHAVIAKEFQHNSRQSAVETRFIASYSKPAIFPMMCSYDADRFFKRCQVGLWCNPTASFRPVGV